MAHPLGGKVVTPPPHGEAKTGYPFNRAVKGDPAFNAASETAKFARTLIGIHEEGGPNEGASVRKIQASTGAFGEPWCVSTIQYICLHVDGQTIANKTAGAYYLRSYAEKAGWTVPHPKVGAFVVYEIGEGHAGTVVTLFKNGTFDAVEGNYANAVELVLRDPKETECTFIVPPWQH